MGGRMLPYREDHRSALMGTHQLGGPEGRAWLWRERSLAHTLITKTLMAPTFTLTFTLPKGSTNQKDFLS